MTEVISPLRNAALQVFICLDISPPPYQWLTGRLKSRLKAERGISISAHPQAETVSVALGEFQIMSEICLTFELFTYEIKTLEEMFLPTWEQMQIQQKCKHTGFFLFSIKYNLYLR